MCRQAHKVETVNLVLLPSTHGIFLRVVVMRDRMAWTARPQARIPYLRSHALQGLTMQGRRGICTNFGHCAIGLYNSMMKFIRPVWDIGQGKKMATSNQAHFILQAAGHDVWFPMNRMDTLSSPVTRLFMYILRITRTSKGVLQDEFWF